MHTVTEIDVIDELFGEVRRFKAQAGRRAIAPVEESVAGAVALVLADEVGDLLCKSLGGGVDRRHACDLEEAYVEGCGVASVSC